VAGGKASGIARGTKPESGFVPSSFTSDTSAKTGMSKSVIKEEVQLARDLTPEAKEAIVKADVPKAAALALVKQTPHLYKKSYTFLQYCIKYHTNLLDNCQNVY